MRPAAEKVTNAPSASRRSVLAGRALSALVILFMMFDATLHFLAPAPVSEAFARLGWPLELSRPIAVVEFLCVVAYTVPQTSALGAVLLTGYLGGAVATHLRAGSPLFVEALFPVYVGVMLWAGLAMRDKRVQRILLPFLQG